jgi:hypothetical protein
MDSPRAAAAPRFLTVTLARDMGLLTALSLMAPFMVHLLPFPEDSRLGPRLLPLFYAPLIAGLWQRLGTATLFALAAPWINHFVTGHPGVSIARLMMVELGTFALATAWLRDRWGLRPYLALPAYAVSKAAAAIAVLLVPSLAGGAGALDWAVRTTGLAWPGLLVLLGINVLIVRVLPSDRGPTAA